MKSRAHLKTIAVLACATLLTACSSKPDTRQHSFRIADTTLSLLTNDVIIDCDLTSKDDICISMSGVNLQELLGKVVAYGLVLNENNWTEYQEPDEIYVPADPLMTPERKYIKYRNFLGNECGDEVIFDMHPSEAKKSMILKLTVRKVNCGASHN